MPTEISGSTGVNKIQDNTIVNADINSSAAIAGSKLVMPTGSVLQVVQAAKTDTWAQAQSGNSLSGSNVTGLTPSITPASTSNKVLITVSVNLGSDSATGTSDVDKGFAIYRSGAVVGVGAADGNRTRLSAMQHHTNRDGQGNLSMTYLDSPNTTSAITYSIRLFNGGGATTTMYLNRASDGNSADTGRTISTITLMEIAG